MNPGQVQKSIIDAETSRTRLWRPIVAALLGAATRVLSTLQPKGWPEDE